LQLQEAARRFSHMRTDRTRSAVDAGMSRLYRASRLIPRPMRPLFRPLWQVVDRSASPHAEKPVGSFPTIEPDRPIRPMSRAEFDELAASNAYYRGRRRYFGVAAWVASDLIERFDLRTALELGPNVRPLISRADVMDRVARPSLEASGKVMVHDATVTPWPIPGERYDLFVALQVFEHLGSGQSAAFAEVRRIARHAIISLPIDWDLDDPRNPHHGITHEQALAWFAPIEPTRVIVGNPGYHQRLIYAFENLG
jgi:hypothetical protein